MTLPPRTPPSQSNVRATPTHRSESSIYAVLVPRSDRWWIYHRLQELMIPCWCLPDGSLQVEVSNGLTVILLHSVVQQSIAPRHQLVDWLNRCWQTKSTGY
jgi:hypothetical protein